MSDKKEHIPQEVKDVFGLIAIVKDSVSETIGNSAKIISSVSNNGITIINNIRNI